MKSRLAGVTLLGILILAGCGGGGGASTAGGTDGTGVSGGSGGSGGTGGGGGTPPAAPAITYAADGGNNNQFQLTAQSTVALTPVNTGGTVATWSIQPAPPAGLTFNSSTGAISGAPSSAFAPTNVTVTATNAGGSSQVTLSLRSDAVLLNMGTQCFVDLSGAFVPGNLALSGTSVLAIQCGYGDQHWVLWNYATGALVAQGDACPGPCKNQYIGGQANYLGLAGQIAVVPYAAADKPGPRGFRVISVTNGSVLSTVAPSAQIAWWSVASDGSYICGTLADNSALNVWAPDGSVIASISGNYRSASIYCAPGQVRVAMGPKGSNVIETITVPSGASSVSPAFAGSFKSWFQDGSAFFSTVGSNVWVYSASAVQQDFRALPTTNFLGGWGSWFWTSDGGTLNIYKVGASASPVATYTDSSTVAPSGPTIAAWGSGSSIHIIDLSGAAPSETDHSMPNGSNLTSTGSLYAAVSASQWVVGTGGEGILLDGSSLATTPRYFGYGALRGLAGSQNRLAVATSIHQILVFKASDLSLETTLDMDAQQVQLSADGSVLAVLSPNNGNNGASVRTVAMPSGADIHVWPATSPNAGPVAITLSASGALLGQVIGASPATRQVTASNGGPVLWSDSGSSSPVQLSLDDTLIAASDGTNSTVYLNDQMSTAIAGVSIGWLPNNLLAANSSGAGTLFSSAGIKQSSPVLPLLKGPLQVVTADSFFDSGANTLYSLSTGAVTWQAPSCCRGAVVGNSVAFQSDNRIVTEPY